MEYEDHIKALGLLVSYFHTLEFALRAVLKNQEKGKLKKIDYYILNTGDLIHEDSMTNYDSLGTLIDKYNGLAPKKLKITKEIVAIRDVIAHGRVFSAGQYLPMKLFKFNKPDHGEVSVAFAATLDEKWFKSTAVRLYEAINKVMKMNEKFS